MPGEDHAAAICELYKFSYGPRAGVLYDIETGLPVKRPKSQLKPPSLLQRMSSTTEKKGMSLQDRLSDNPDELAQDSMPVDNDSGDTDSTDEDFLCVHFEELSDELFDPRAVNSPAAWIRHNDQKLERAQRQAADHRNTRGDLQVTHHRSQSPVRLSDPYYVEHEKPKIMFRRMLWDESAKITYTESIWSAPAFAWNLDFLEVAHFFIPDLESEAHLCYWANCWNTLGTVKRLLTTAIEHGICFFLALPLDRTHQFRPIIVDSLNHSSAASLYGVNFQEATLSQIGRAHV